MNVTLPLFGLGLCLCFTACNGNHQVPPPDPAPRLFAEPAVAHPGALVLLRPMFDGDTARIDPFVGPVESGLEYEIGPLDADTQFTLTVTTGGVDETVALDVPVRYREVVTVVPPSPIARTRAGSTQLADGRVLQAGGASPGPTFWANAETFEVVSGRFTPVGELATARAESTLVALPGGGALSFGGVISANDFLLSTLVEEWDPVALAWSSRGNLSSTRLRHTATLLPGGLVLVAGGVAAGGPAIDRDAQIWVPGVGPRSPANEMLIRRAAHTATTLADGRVLLIGGYNLGSGDAVQRCEYFDPVTETFAAGPMLNDARFYHAAVRLADDRVLVIGGEQEGITLLRSAEIFDPVTGAFTRTGSLESPRTEVAAVRLLGGDVLVAGGLANVGAATARIEVWSPVSGTWRTWAAGLPSGRTGHALHTLPDGRVAVLGGDDGSGFPTPFCCVLD